jgi:transketolase
VRDTFIAWLCQEAVSDPRIILLTADLGYSVVEPFVRQFPGRFVNVGVAEQNMVGIAAGLALEGFRPFTYSIGIFPTFRCAEQLRNDVDYHVLPVCSCMVGSGLAYGALGYTHHAIQDLALMRSLPSTTIATPSDSSEVQGVLNWQIGASAPMYLRLHKRGEPDLHTSVPTLEPCRPLQVHTTLGAEACVVVVGFLASEVLRLVMSHDVSVDVYTMPLWDMKHRNRLMETFARYETIISVEDHMLDGGFGSWLLETLASNRVSKICIPIAIPPQSVGKVACEQTLLDPLLASFEHALLML